VGMRTTTHSPLMDRQNNIMTYVTKNHQTDKKVTITFYSTLGISRENVYTLELAMTNSPSNSLNSRLFNLGPVANTCLLMTTLSNKSIQCLPGKKNYLFSRPVCSRIRSSL